MNPAVYSKASVPIGLSQLCEVNLQQNISSCASPH